MFQILLIGQVGDKKTTAVSTADYWNQIRRTLQQLVVWRLQFKICNRKVRLIYFCLLRNNCQFQDFYDAINN